MFKKNRSSLCYRHYHISKFYFCIVLKINDSIFQSFEENVHNLCILFKFQVSAYSQLLVKFVLPVILFEQYFRFNIYGPPNLSLSSNSSYP